MYVSQFKLCVISLIYICLFSLFIDIFVDFFLFFLMLLYFAPLLVMELGMVVYLGVRANSSPPDSMLGLSNDSLNHLVIPAW